jgi:hypothetical protein
MKYGTSGRRKKFGRRATNFVRSRPWRKQNEMEEAKGTLDGGEI